MTPVVRRPAQAQIIWLCGALVCGLGLTYPASSAFSQSKPAVAFSIPAQPLAAALDAFSSISGRELFYDGELAVGRRSNAVEGLLPPDIALRKLLIGTGLFARATGANSVTIVPESLSRVGIALHQSFFARVQTRVSQALCAHPESRGGDTDLVVQIWIAPSGTVQRVQLLDGAEGGAQEHPLATALRGIRIGTPPPPEIPQPITMAVLGGGETNGCAQPATSSGR